MKNISYKNIIIFVLLAIPTTLFNLAILYIINNVISGKIKMFQNYLWVFFISIIIISYFVNIVYHRKVINYSNYLIYENEIKLFAAIQKTNLEQLEKLGFERVYSTFEDLRIFAYFPNIISNTINSILIIIVCLIYLLSISVKATCTILFVISILVLLYFLIISWLSKKVKLLRALNEYYYKLIDDLLKGFKELKVSNIRSNNLFEKYFIPNRKNVKDVESSVANNVLWVNSISQYGLYFILGIILFVLPTAHILKYDEVVPFVIILLFISGPITNLISMQSFYARFIIASRRYNNFFEDLECIQNKKLVSIESNDNIHEFNSLFFENVSYKYNSTLDDFSFSLGPISLSINRGDTIFIVGGNGSGKSTFINILSGLYIPTSGNIYLNGKIICNDNQNYQGLMSTIFTDSHLFTSNYENYSLENNKDFEQLVKLMNLNNAVQMDEGYSIMGKLSKGQSKRMAMILALLENHPILVLDEWAADLDPHFRKYFYEKILPELKTKAKTIVAVTHDETYFKHADRIIKFTDGRIEKDIHVNRSTFSLKEFWEV